MIRVHLPTTIHDAFLASLPDERRLVIAEIRKVVKEKLVAGFEKARRR